jgi:proteasome lid subunit RPN8/RPN11
MKYLLVLAALLSTSAAAADLESVAVDALRACASMPDSTRFEYGGAIIKTADGYRYSVPVRGSKNEVRYTVRLAHGEAIVALYHSHTGHQTIDEAFSHRDVLNAMELNVPSYIIIPGRDNHVRVFVPSPGADRLNGYRYGQLLAV